MAYKIKVSPLQGDDDFTSFTGFEAVQPGTGPSSDVISVPTDEESGPSKSGKVLSSPLCIIVFHEILET